MVFPREILDAAATMADHESGSPRKSGDPRGFVTFPRITNKTLGTKNFP